MSHFLQSSITFPQYAHAKEFAFHDHYLEAFLSESRNRAYGPNTIRAYCIGLSRILEASRKTAFEPGEGISRFLSAYNSKKAKRIAWNVIKLFARWL